MTGHGAGGMGHEASVTTSTMELTVNGEKRQVPDGTTAAQLLTLLQIAPERVVMEVNLTILKRAQLPGAVLKEDDQVEIVQFIGGGSGCRLQAASRKAEMGLMQLGAWSLELERLDQDG